MLIMISKHKAHQMLVGVFILITHVCLGQDQNIADSLALVYKNEKPHDTIKLELLRNLSFNEVNSAELSLQYAEELISLSKELDDPLYLHRGFLQKGYNELLLGNLDEALKAQFMALEAVQRADYKVGIGNVLGAIADTYIVANDHSNGKLYYNKSIDIIRKTNDSIALASVLLNAGNAQRVSGNYDSSLLYFSESNFIFKKFDHYIGMAYNLGNSGMAYAQLGEHELASLSLNQAISILKKTKNYQPICEFLISSSDIYAKKDDLNIAISLAINSLTLAKKHHLKQQISEAHQKLFEFYDRLGDPNKSLLHYKQHIVYRDSVNNLSSVQKMANLRTEYEVNLREKEIDLLEEQDALNRTYLLIGIVLLLLAIALLLYFRQRFLNTKLIAQKERNEHNEKVQSLMQEHQTRALESMVQGKEDERKRLAQELHNHFGSLLATIKVNLNGIDDLNSPYHQTVSSLVDQACTDIRSMSHQLNMGVSEDFGLVPALKELTQQLHHPGELAVEFKASICDNQLDSKCEIVIYRIVQELVSNVLKHANASQLSVLLTCFEEEQLINILVHDNGKGFDPNYVQNNRNGMGLKSLAHMVAEQNGEINIDSNPKSGTSISIDLPLVTVSDLAEAPEISTN